MKTLRYQYRVLRKELTEHQPCWEGWYQIEKIIKSDEAVALYQKAFDAVLISSYPNEDGTFFHSELDIQGEILAVAERNSEYAITGEKVVTGNVMQFCLHYGEGNEEKVRKAYEVLKTDAKILMPLAPCEFSSLMTDFIDKYGIRWCLFV